MKTKRPETRTEANAPKAVEHLSTEQQQALETSGEAEHATGESRERQTKVSRKLGGDRPS